MNNQKEAVIDGQTQKVDVTRVDEILFLSKHKYGDRIAGQAQHDYEQNNKQIDSSHVEQKAGCVF